MEHIALSDITIGSEEIVKIRVCLEKTIIHTNQEKDSIDIGIQ